ncbi:MAG: SGNH/GDSL hydrolase family protein [Clostridia bacterium]|nr:SGNH/GDSL hydrolase family protein [Clostridia bacterium]
MALKKGDLILFQGDSITDCGRSREDLTDLGPGYPHLVAASLGALRSEQELRFLNRAISGNRTSCLLDRWSEDCIELRPALLSILVGINDVWHREKGIGNTDAELKANYTALLTRVREELGDIPVVMLEPFLTPDSVANIKREEVDSVRAIVRGLAEGFGATFVPLDAPLAAVSEAFPPHALTKEGVHPTEQGHAIIAKHWLDAVLPLL